MKRKRRRRIEPLPRSMWLNSYYYPDTRLKRRQSGVSFQMYDLGVVEDDLPFGNEILDDDIKRAMGDTPPIRRDDI